MAFGRLTTKWRIFRRNLEYSMEMNSLICMVATKLHNFIIDDDLASGADALETIPFSGAPNGLGYLPHNPSEADGTLESDPLHQEVQETPGQSSRRENFLHFIQVNGLERPEWNINRNG